MNNTKDNLENNSDIMVQDLMKPRYKVIADYPHSVDEIGHIITIEGERYFTLSNASKSTQVYPVDKRRTTSEYYNRYPHLFELLPWYVERSVEDLQSVKYLKLVYNNRIQYLHKVERFNGENLHGQPLYEYYNKVNHLSTACVSELEPATESEYTQFTNQISK